MLASKAWLYGKLSTCADLLAVTGMSTSNISDMRSETIETFPMVVYTDESQVDTEYVDNKPRMSQVAFKIDIFTKIGADYPTTTAIGIPIAAMFIDLFFHCSENSEVPDDTEGVRHRVMRFSRALLPTDLV